MSLVVPAVLPASRRDLEEKLEFFIRIPAVNRVQIDVVDGRFIAPMSWPYTAPEEWSAMVARAEMLPFLDHFEYEIDLMCFDADRAAASWLALGATRLTFHAESMTDLPRFLAVARRRFGAGDDFASGLISFGLALDLTSDLALIEPCIGEIAYVELMGIARIGRQGQPFDRRAIEKVRAFRERYPNIPLQVDGGISFAVARELIALRVTNLIVGSALLHAGDPTAAFAAFESLQNSYGV